MKNLFSYYKLIKTATKDDLEYLVLLGSLLFTLYKLVEWSLGNFPKAPVVFNLGSLILISILIIVVKNRAILLAKRLMFKGDLTVFSVEAKKESERAVKNTQKINFEKLIPSTRIMNYLVTKQREIARKELYDDVVTSTSYLSIVVGIGQPVRSSLHINFFSPYKKTTIQYNCANLKPYRSTKRLLQKGGYYTGHFAEDPKWREAVVAALNHCEAELIGKEGFSCLVSNIGSNTPVFITIFPKGEAVEQQLSYSYQGGILYEGSPQNNGQVKRLD